MSVIQPDGLDEPGGADSKNCQDVDSSLLMVAVEHELILVQIMSSSTPG